MESKNTGDEIIQGILEAGKLAAAIKSMISLIPKAPDELKDKHRWMTIKISNETQFNLVYLGDHFNKGRLWDKSSGNIAPFEHMVVSVCSRDGSLLTGVRGGIAFKLQMPSKPNSYQNLKFGIGFSHPEVGLRKCEAFFKASPKKAFERISKETSKNSTSKTSKIFTGRNVKGKQVSINFLLVSSPGTGSNVTITEQIIKD